MFSKMDCYIIILGDLLYLLALPDPDVNYCNDDIGDPASPITSKVILISDSDLTIRIVFSPEILRIN